MSGQCLRSSAGPKQHYAAQLLVESKHEQYKALHQHYMVEPYGDVESDFAGVPIYRPHKLDSVPLLHLAQEIGDVIIAHVDTALKYEQLRSPQVYSLLVQPIVSKIKRNFLSGGTLYSLLANKIHFANAAVDLASAQVWTTRSMICELIAIKLINEFTRDELAQCMVFEFYPLADGKLTAQSVVPDWLRVSPLELAILGEAKRFLSHPALVELTSDLWSGMLVFDPSLYKAHRLNLRSRYELAYLIESHRGLICRYDLGGSSKLKLSRLRVPKYRHVSKVLSMFVLILLYVSLLRQHQLEPTIREAAFSLWALAFCVDELQSLRKAGSSLYFQTLWSTIDFCTVVLLFVYWVMRAAAVLQGSDLLNSWAYDILATVAVGLVPRVFCVLDASEGFSRMVISVRKLSIELFYCWAAMAIFSLGFWAALSRFAAGRSTPGEVLYEMFQILFGFTPAVWSTWQNYSVIGSIVLFLYLFMVHFVVLTLVIAALSARYAEIQERSLEEHHYLLAVKTMAKIKTERSTLFVYAEPLNLISYVLKPFIYVLPITAHLQLNRLVVKATHWPLLFGIYAYEKLLWNIEKHKKAQKERQDERIQLQLQHQPVDSARPMEAPVGSPNKRRTTNYDARRTRPPPSKLYRSMAKTSTLDLIESALSQSYLGLGSANNTISQRRPTVQRENMASIPGLGISQRGGGVASPPNHPTAFDTLPRRGKIPTKYGGDTAHGHGLHSGDGAQNAPRARTYSTTSSLLRNYNTLRLSPARSFTFFRGDSQGGNIGGDGDEADDNSDHESMIEEEGDELAAVIVELDNSNKRIESMLAAIIHRMEDLDSRIRSNI